MQKAFRPSLEPPAHRRINLERGGRPWCCILLTSVVLSFVFAIFGVSGWNLYIHQYDVTEYVYNDGDQVALSGVARDFSTVLCQEYEVRLDSPGGRVYQLSHRAAVNRSETITQRMAAVYRKHQLYAVREFYLLPGSRLDILGCHENVSHQATPVQIFLIKGRGHYKKWQRNERCQDCFFKRMVISDEANCTDNLSSTLSAPSTFNISILDSDQYILVVSYGRESTSVVVVNVTVTRTLFELRDPEVNCTVRDEGNNECDLKLPWNSDTDVVVNFSGDAEERFTDTKRKLHTRCRIRLAFWILVFAGVPVALAIPISFIFFWFLCRKRKKFGKVKRLSSQSEVKVRDDSCLVENDVLDRTQEDSCMAIQDA